MKAAEESSSVRRTVRTHDARVHIPKEGINSSSDIHSKEVATWKHCGP